MQFAPTPTDAYSGQGAAIRGQRWNSRGVALAYASENAALALVEYLAHLKELGFVPKDLLFFPADLPDDALAPATPPPNGWDTSPPSPETAQFGDSFVRSGRHLVIAVPSVVIPFATNYLLNPAHAQFAEVTFGTPIPYVIDRRLQP